MLGSKGMCGFISVANQSTSCMKNITSNTLEGMKEAILHKLEKSYKLPWAEYLRTL